MKHILSLLIIGSLGSAGFGADVVITSLMGNGQLSWTNATTPASYRVEWAPSVAGPWQQFHALTNLDSIKTTNTTVTVVVPMFYRVVWTDAPAFEPVGDWDFQGYSFAGSLVVTGVISATNSIGGVAGTWAFGAIPNGTNTWWLLCSSGEARGSTWGDSRFSMSLDGCSLAEGAYYLNGRLLGDTFSGMWYESGIWLNPMGSFVARRRSGSIALQNEP